jgi:hypothetical protein
VIRVTIALLLVAGCASNDVVAATPEIPQSLCADDFAAELPTQNLHFPLELQASSDAAPEYVAATVAAAEFWNARVSARLFDVRVVERPAHECGVVALSTDAPPPGYRGYTDWNACSATVHLRVRPQDGASVRVAVVAHELGHVLNLQHDESEPNLMSEHQVTARITPRSRCMVATALTLADGELSRMRDFR